MPTLSKSVDAVLWSTGVVLVIATLIAGLAKTHWLFDTVANLRIQGCIAILCVLTLALALRRWQVAVVLGLLFPYNLWFVSQGSPATASLPLTGEGVRIGTINVLATNKRYESVVENIREMNADVVAVVELTPGLADVLQEKFKESHRYQTFHERDDNNFGIGVLSRFPIRSIQTLQWQETPMSLEVAFDRFRMIATHPIPPIGQSNFQIRNRQLINLAAHIRATADEDNPTILVGDLNLTPWNANFTELLSTAGLQRAASTWEVRPTWYARPAFPLGLLIDHVLISQGLAFRDYCIGGECGSDHRSVSVTIDFLGEANDTQNR